MDKKEKDATEERQSNVSDDDNDDDVSVNDDDENKDTRNAFYTSNEKDKKRSQMDVDVDDTNAGRDNNHKGKMDEDDDNDEIDTQREVVMTQSSGVVSAEAVARWATYVRSTEVHANRLCEQLRLILEPTLRTRLQGDYRTGKRINMKKVIDFVASGFRKDKIWLRRAKPAKRDYQVMLMIDDSASMGLAGPLALQAMATLATALRRFVA